MCMTCTTPEATEPLATASEYYHKINVHTLVHRVRMADSFIARVGHFSHHQPLLTSFAHLDTA